MNFMFIDILFLIIFCLFTGIFLYVKRKNLKREGLLFLYRTQLGIKIINYIGDKYKKTLYVLSYVSIFTGYVLMAVMLYMLGKIIYIYVAFPQIVKAIKVPPVMPLIPYLPQMFKLDYLPPFYFTYWIVTLAIIAITHEFSHGIFMRRYEIRIKSTGFGFLGPFLAAFVEQDDEQMKTKNKFSQISVLSAGTFANIITAIVFLVILWLFFLVSFTPAGVVFNTYSYSIIPLNNISSVNGFEIENPNYMTILNLMNNESMNRVTAGNTTYLISQDLFEQQQNYSSLILFDDSPALKAGMIGAISKFNGIEIKNRSILEIELKKYSPGDKVTILTKTSNDTITYDIILQGRPDNSSAAWLGIGFEEPSKGNGLLSKIYYLLSYFREEGVYYEAKSEYITFFYDLLWWVILISLSVALVNMLPVGIFDGGGVFYLTVLAITKNEKISKKIFSFVTYLFLFLLLLLMILWAFSFI